MKLNNKEHYIDCLTASTYNEDAEEICCPNCGSWTYTGYLLSDPEEIETYCPMCSPFHNIQAHIAHVESLEK